MSYLTRPYLESLDLLIASNTHPQIKREIQNVTLYFDSVQDQPQQTIPPEEFANFEYIGAILPQVYENNYPTAFHLIPILAKKNNPSQPNGSIDCFIYGSPSEHQLSFHHDIIEINPEIHQTKYSLYQGQGDYLIVDLFEKPLPFDPTKEFFFVRSPNNSIQFDNTISTCKIEEKIKLQEWMIYHNEKERIILDESSKYASPKILEEWIQRHVASKYTSWLHLEESTGVPHLTLFTGNENNPWPNITTYDNDQKSYGPHKDTTHAAINYFELPYSALDSFDHPTFDPTTSPFTKIPDSQINKKPKITNSYSLIYTSLSDLLKNKRWAFNNVLQSTFIDEYNGFTFNLNQHLKK